MSAINSKTDDDNQSKTANTSSLRSANSIEQERRRKLVKFNAVPEIKELSDDSTHSKLSAFEVDTKEIPANETASTSVRIKEKEAKMSFHSKRRNHYKDEFTNSKTSKHEDQSD